EQAVALLEIADGLDGQRPEVAIVGDLEATLHLSHRRADGALLKEDLVAGLVLELAGRCGPGLAGAGCARDERRGHRRRSHGGAECHRRLLTARDGLAGILRKLTPAAGAV